MKIFISMPMNGLDEDTVLERMNEVKSELYIRYGYEIEFVDSFETENLPKNISRANKRLWYLGNSLIKMAECDCVCFSFGWEKTPGCQVEYEAAIRYGLKCIFLENDTDPWITSEFYELLV